MTIDSVYKPEDFLPDGEEEFTFQYEHIGVEAIQVRIQREDGSWIIAQPEAQS